MGQEASGNRTNDTWRPFSGSKVPKRITRVPLESRKLQKNSSICFGGSGEALLLFPFLCHFVNGTSMECYIKIAASFNGGGFVVEISSGHATLAIQDGTSWLSHIDLPDPGAASRDGSFSAIVHGTAVSKALRLA